MTVPRSAGVKAREQTVAQGFRVLSAHGDPSEVSLNFSGAADLLADVDAAIIDQLPPVQRGALNRVLLRDSGPLVLNRRQHLSPTNSSSLAVAAFRYTATIRLVDRVHGMPR